eukprot:15867-Heterococcus_DN1.PRE.1
MAPAAVTAATTAIVTAARHNWSSAEAAGTAGVSKKQQCIYCCDRVHTSNLRCASQMRLHVKRY